MNLNKFFMISITICLVLLSLSSVSANDVNDANQALASDSLEIGTVAVSEDIEVVQEIESSDNDVLDSNLNDSKLQTTSEEITVNDWNDLQYYCSLTDKDYVLKLKENTNYYPDSVSDSNYQIIVKNNVKIIGNSGAYIGDTSPNAGNITYTAIKTDDDSGVGITMENVTFKWIGTRYQPDGVFLQMGGNVNNSFINCYFTEISTNLGHSSILHIKKGHLIMTNCTFINCTTDFGCLSVYNPKDDPTGLCTLASMEVNDCYFEGNYARTEPGCINNCGILVVNNSTFYKNSAFWWAGAIHTHGGANTTIYDSDFIDNLAGWNGGALYTYSYLQIYNTRFIGNNCTTNNGGGAIGACKYLHAPYIHIEECLFENNENLCWGLDELSTSGTGRGGAISLMDEGGLEVYNSVFIKNSASIGTAICAINGGLTYGSPDVRIVGNRFINHTRIGDVLDVRVATGSVAEIRDNYYYNNSLVYEKLKLTVDDPVDGYVTFHLDASLKNPTSFDADILDKSKYDVYINGVYNTTVSSRTFTLFLGKGNSANVYVMPSISNSISNEVFAGVAKEYIYVSPSGNDENNGSTRNAPVKTLARAIELARSTENIVIMGGTFNEANLTINYNLTITGENGATITVTGQGFTITDGDVKFENITFKNCKYGSSTKNRLITQSNSGFLIIEGCIFESNEYKTHIEANGILQGQNLQFIKNKDGSVIKSDSLYLKSSVFINNTATYSLSKGLVMYKSSTTKFEVENLTFINNIVSAGCIDVKKNKATITDCTFIGNSISTSSNKGSSILIEDSCSVLIESSKFINNKDIGKYSSVIYISSGTLVIRDSILINNSYENTNGIVINGGETYLKKLQAHNNWWGNTPDNLAKPALKVYGVSNQLPNGWDPAKTWLVLNATALSNEIELDQMALVQFSFNQIDNEGNITYYDGLKLPIFDLTLTAVNGTCSNQKILVENGIGQTYFTLTNIGPASLTGSFNGIDSTINFTFKKSTPELSIEANNISVGQTANVIVHVPSDATGNVVLKVGSVTKTATISNSKATFSIPNLAAGTYNVIANYTGNEKYASTIETGSLTVNKFESSTEISVGTLELGEDVTVTIAVTNGATGTVDVYYDNGNPQTINVGETYTINAVTRGDHVIRAVYSGDSKYLPSEDEYVFEVGKLTPTLTVDVPDITYGEDAVVTVTLNNGATGNVTVTIDGKSNTTSLVNNVAVVKLSGIDAGNNKYVDVYYSGCNDYKNASTSKTFNVAKANIDFTISSSNIMLGKEAVVQIVLPARCGGSLKITGIKSETKNVPASGVVTLTYEDLDVGSYTVKATYTGNNYNTKTKTTKFNVLDWNQPQWANEAGDIKHTGKSTYITDVNGEIKWSASVGEITGNLAIDSEGNIYVATANVIYSFDANGNLRWTYESSEAGDYFSGIAISRDVIIAPKSSDTLYLINQSTGERFGHANLYQGSSDYSPIVDYNGNIYIAGQGGDGQNPNLVVIPYRIWENGGNPTVIALGGNPVAAPTIIDDGLVVIPCDNGIKIVDVYFNEISSINGVISNGYAVVDEYGIIYSFLGNSIVAKESTGSSVWTKSVTGGIGKQLFLNSEIGIYSVNSKGDLYVYDILEGTESKFCDLKVTSGILIGSDNNLYFASYDYLYAFDSDANVLWKAKLGSDIVGTPIMDNNGIIYVNTADKLFALMNSDLKASGIKVTTENIDIGSDETITITLNENCTGTVNITVNGQTYTENVVNRSIVKVIPDLPAGTYTAKVTYSGDMRYSPITKSPKFTVAKLDPYMNVTAKNINYGQKATFNVALPSDATGTVSVRVGTKSGSANVSEGKATIKISGLTNGDYQYNVTYSGDDKYSSDTKISTISVNKTTTTFNVRPIADVNVDDYAIFNIYGLPSDANGIITVVVGDLSNSSQVNNGTASISIKMPAEGTYTAEISYSNDDNYMANAKTAQFNVNKIMPNMTVSVSNIKVGANAVFKVTGLPSDATGNVLVTVDDKSKSGIVSNGAVTIKIAGLTSGTKTATISYLGDNKYQSVNVTKTFKVTKNNPTITVDYNTSVYVGDSVDFNIVLNSDASGTVTIVVDGKTGTGEVVNGESTITIASLTEGTKTPQISYSGDEKYNSATPSAQNINVVKRDGEITVNPIDDIYVGENATFDIILTPDMAGYITVVCGDNFNETYDAKSRVSVTIPGLSYGTKNIDIIYSGDTKYNPKTVAATVNVIKNQAILTGSNLVMKYNDGSSWTVTLTDADGNAIGNVGVGIGIVGKVYTINADSNGVASLPINLKPGTYNVNATFENDVYKSNLVTAKITVNKATSKLTAKNLVMKYNDGSSWSVTLKDGTGKAISNANVGIGILGKVYTFTTNSKGVAKLPVTLAPGVYDVNASFADSNYVSSFVSATITVNKAISSLTANNLVMTYNDGSSWAVTLKDGTGKAISNVAVGIGIVGKVYTFTTDASGIASLLINLAPGTYNVNASFNHARYESSFVSATIAVNKANPTLATNNLVMFYKDGSSFKATLKDNKGKAIVNTAIKFTILGRTYTVETDSNGVASLAINLKQGTYDISTKFEGNNKFYAVVVNNTITVKDSGMSISANDVNMVYKDGTSYNVQLIDSKNQPVALANEIVKITIVGKTYDIKTNGNGIASLPINLKAGTYPVTAEYNGKTISNTVTVNSV
ncbi:MAG: Ig-like domain repeat protein [Methanobrevibacter sp.]|nr:Ig-like domain repeat protein [Methanobrevibacter sp.]